MSNEQEKPVVSQEDIEKGERLKNEANEYFKSKFRALESHVRVLYLYFKYIYLKIKQFF